MASILSLAFFLALSISVGATTTTSSYAASETLTSACKQTPEPETCLKYLSVFPKNSTGNIHNITEIAVRAASILAKEIQTLISSLENETSAISGIKQCVNGSEAAIANIVLQFNNLTEAVHNRSLAEASVWISEAWTDAETVENSCKQLVSGLINDLKNLLKIISSLFKLGGN